MANKRLKDRSAAQKLIFPNPIDKPHLVQSDNHTDTPPRSKRPSLSVDDRGGCIYVLELPCVESKIHHVPSLKHLFRI